MAAKLPKIHGVSLGFSYFTEFISGMSSSPPRWAFCCVISYGAGGPSIAASTVGKEFKKETKAGMLGISWYTPLNIYMEHVLTEVWKTIIFLSKWVDL